MPTGAATVIVRDPPSTCMQATSLERVRILLAVECGRLIAVTGVPLEPECVVDFNRSNPGA